jgi:hypothetical protein
MLAAPPQLLVRAGGQAPDVDVRMSRDIELGDEVRPEGCQGAFGRRRSRHHFALLWSGERTRRRSRRCYVAVAWRHLRLRGHRRVVGRATRARQPRKARAPSASSRLSSRTPRAALATEPTIVALTPAPWPAAAVRARHLEFKLARRHAEPVRGGRNVDEHASSWVEQLGGDEHGAGVGARVRLAVGAGGVMVEHVAGMQAHGQQEGSDPLARCRGVEVVGGVDARGVQSATMCRS